MEAPLWTNLSNFVLTFKAQRPVVAQGHECVTVNVTGCWFDPHSKKINIYINLYFHFLLVKRQSAALPSRILLTECFNTMFSLPILLCAEHSVKLIKHLKSNISYNKFIYTMASLTKRTKLRVQIKVS